MIRLVIGLLALIMTVAPSASADAPQGQRWLALVVDCSDSIDDGEYRLQKDAYVTLLKDPLVQSALDRTRITIIEFSAEPVVVVEWTRVRIAGHAYALSAKADVCERGTGVARALRLAVGLLVERDGARVIDVSGDGVDNIEDHPRAEAVAAVRDQAHAQDIRINGLAIDDKEGLPIANYYAEHVVSGFLVGVQDLRDFRRALMRKLFAEIAQLNGEMGGDS